LAGQKREREREPIGKFCAHHKVDTHSTEECHFLLKGKQLAKSGKSQRLTREKGKTGKRVTATTSSKQPIKNETPVNEARFQKLEATLEALLADREKEKVPAKKIRILKSSSGENCIHYLDHITDGHILTENPVYLDSGANQHVVPQELIMEGVREVRVPYILTDATNNQTVIQMEGDFSHSTGDDRIILTASHAYHQSANSKDLHEIARVVNGMYCMNPLERIDGKAKEAAAHLIHCSNLGTPTSHYDVIKEPGTSSRYSKPRLFTYQSEVEQAGIIDKVYLSVKFE
jgi:hypothetical protein